MLLKGAVKTQQSQVILDLCLRKTRSRKSRDLRDVIVFEKFRFPSTRKRKAGVRLKCASEKLPFRDGLVWTVGLTIEIKLRFQIPPV